MYKSRTKTLSIGLLSLSLTLMPIAGADQKKAGKKEATPSQSGMVVAKDPVTGELRAPTAEEAAALNNAAAETRAKTNATGPRMVKGPGGAVGMVLDESTTVYTVATRKPGGKISTQEVTGKAAASKATNSPAKQGGNNEK